MLRDKISYHTASARWAGVGPYYAMFPCAFADSVVNQYTNPGDTVLDPFAGRGTAVFSAAINGRHGIGIEISPVGWVYAQTKLKPAGQESVLQRLGELSQESGRYRDAALELPVFFHLCFRTNVREFLLAARAMLDWRNRAVDRTLMAMILVNLHGKQKDSLSNQMRQTKALSPRYAVKWWREHSPTPPEVDPVEFLTKRIAWRYAKGRPETAKSRMHLGDSTNVLPQLVTRLPPSRDRVRLLLTSPPYYGITNYYYDQWLRLWLLGGRPDARRPGGRSKGKFEHRLHYLRLLESVFAAAKSLLSPDATVYVRTDSRDLTLSVTQQVLSTTFPKHDLHQVYKPYLNPTQTRLFGHGEPRAGEVDLILTR